MELVVEVVALLRRAWPLTIRRTDRYDIDSVMGPDEFHDGYPGRPGSGRPEQRLHQHLAGLDPAPHRDSAGSAGPRRRRQDLPPARASAADELERWDRLSRRLRVPFHADGVISQFEGYE